ncbi:MAG: hypothetical protein NTY99_02940 [DPANN group archaeon]|nr:hypothetical protein [DPANN group archaeon]
MAEVLAHAFIHDRKVTGKNLELFSKFTQGNKQITELARDIRQVYSVNIIDSLFMNDKPCLFWEDSNVPLLVIKEEEKYYLGDVSVLYEACSDFHINRINFIDENKSIVMRICWSMLNQGDLVYDRNVHPLKIDENLATGIIRAGFDYCMQNKLYYQYLANRSQLIKALDGDQHKILYEGKTLPSELEEVLAKVKLFCPV